ncbi:hypothetical protein J437_LFUL001059, partial [Ladona fulva]
MDGSDSDDWESDENITEESPALVSLEAIEAEDGRKGLGTQEEASSFGGGRSPAACLFLALWYAVISHSELVCYFTVFLHQIKSASLLSIPLPLMVFLWGTLSVPRPSKTFWVTIIAYTEVMVLIKCMFQFDYLPWNQQAIPENLPFFPPRIIGIERKKKYAVYDLTLLLVVFFHRFMLKSLGLWKSTNVYDDYLEEDRGSLTREVSSSSSTLNESPSKKTVSIKNKSISDSVAEKATISEMETEGPTTQCGDLVIVRTKVQESLRHFPQVVSLAASKYLSSIKIFLHQLLEPTTRVTADVYAYMFMCDFFNFIVVIFGFAAFGTQQGDGGVSAYLEENKVPVPFLVMLILQVMVLIKCMFQFDYLPWNQQAIPENLPFFPPRIIGIERKKKYAVYDLTLLLVVFFHRFMLKSLGLWKSTNVYDDYLEEDRGSLTREVSSSSSTLNESPSKKTVSIKNKSISDSVAEKATISEMETEGPTTQCGDLVIVRTKVQESLRHFPQVVSLAFMNIPFLFELRALMDWIWTDTSMTLSDWLKLEDIYSHIFQLKCQRRVEKEYPQPRGKRKRPLSKYIIGGGFLLGILAVIWFPLVLFALGNTVGEVNLPHDVTLELRVGAYQPVFRMTAQNNSLLRFSERNWNAFGSVYKKDRVAQTFLSNYDWQDVSVAKLSGSSTATWTISPPAKHQMILEVL